MTSRSVIRSASNPLVKRVRAVLAGKDRELVVLEGDRLVEDAHRAGLVFEAVLASEDRVSRWEDEGAPVFEVDADLLERVTGLATAPGIVALCRTPPARSWDDLAPEVDDLWLVAAGVADPGNLGALARSAEAAGARGLVAVGGASPWKPKALRGSMGSLLRLPVLAEGRGEVAAAELSSRGYRQVLAAQGEGEPMGTFDWSGPLALWVCSETGREPECTRGFERVHVEMKGPVDSLNVAVAASVLLFAAGRVAGRNA